MGDGDLADRLATLEAKLDHLTTLVESLVAGAHHGSPAAATDDELWRRLGLTEGERRIVTVLFADVTGFTALSEQLDPEAFQLVMRDTMALLASCVAEEGGTLEKFIGDALCAVFGAPLAHPDEPQRAARAALAMHERLAERARSRPDLPALGVHVGINTGPVIAGAVGDGSQFGVMGDTINTAARLMGIAGDTETFVSAETARRLRHEFRLEDRGLHEMKGKSKPVPAAALLGVLDAGEAAGGIRMRLPLVGRGEELAVLRAHAERAAAGDGATVLVVGDDGVGTSRLADELADELAGGGWRVLRSSARVHAETPLGFVAAALGELLHDEAGDVAGGAAGPLGEALLAGGSVAPHDFELVLGDVVTAAARVAPLLVVLDDADAADPGSVEVIRYLSRSTGDERVLWVLTGNCVPPPFEPLVGGGDVTVLDVEPLPDAAVEELFDALFPGALTAPQRARLAHLADGSVQFAEEIALTLIDDGVLVEDADGRWVVVGDVDACELPGSVAELVEARIDLLSTASRVTLQDASVVGQRFSRRLLERVATIPTSLDAALAELVEDGLVVPAGEQELWSFRSRLVREVAYGSILRRRRPAAHRAVADALLELEGDRAAENADLLAHHFEEGDDPALAVPHLLEALARAERAFNLTGALERARRALRLRDRFPGRVADADAVRLLQRVGVNKLLLGDRTGHVELEDAVDLLVESGAGPEEVAVLAERVGWYLVVDGQREAAAPHLERAVSLSSSPAVLAAVATTRAYADAAVGETTGAAEVVDRAVADARAAGDRFAEARAEMVAGVLRLWSGDPAGAADRLRLALDLARAGPFATIADRCGRWLVAALVESGRGDEAVEEAQPILARADDRGDPTVACSIRASLARWWRGTGDVERARAVAVEAAAVAASRRVLPDAVADTHLVLAELAADEGDPVGAEGHLADLAALVHAEPWLASRSAARAGAVRDRMASPPSGTVPAR